jgi:hypothetical protein
MYFIKSVWTPSVLTGNIFDKNFENKKARADFTPLGLNFRHEKT